MSAFNQYDTPMTMEEFGDMPMTMEELGGLPDFFQTTGQELMLEPLEQPGEETVDEVFVIDNRSIASNITNDDFEDEQISHELLDFFEGITYEELGDHFRSFEFGDIWRSNPIFADQFAICCLPTRLYDMVVELHSILQIRTVVGRTRDLRYSSLSEPQQTQVRELVHANPEKHRKLDDLYNRLKGFRSRTESYQIKFLLNLTLDVVQDVLRKNIE